MKSSEYSVPDGSKSSVYRFSLWVDVGRDMGKVKCQKPSKWTTDGFLIDKYSLNRRLMILAGCTFVSLIVGVATGGWPSEAQYGLGIVLSFLLVVFGTAIRYYRHLRFIHAEKELSIRKFQKLKFDDVEKIWPSTTNRVELNSWPAVTDKICDEWGSGVGGCNMKKLKDQIYGRVSGSTEKLHTSTTNVSQALKVTPLQFLAGLAFVSLIGSLATGEWLSGDLDGHGLEIVLAILLVVMIQKFWMKVCFYSLITYKLDCYFQLWFCF